jgi:hypothetical protein
MEQSMKWFPKADSGWAIPEESSEAFQVESKTDPGWAIRGMEEWSEAFQVESPTK